MNTRKLTITVNIPAWVPTTRQLFAWYRTAKFKVLPFRCEYTGVRMNFKYPQYSYQHANRVMISTLNHIRCRAQWIEYVRTYFALPVSRLGIPELWAREMTPMLHKCDSCGTFERTIGMAPDLRIGIRWWNGFHVCETCLVETIRLGVESSTIFLFKNGTSWPINEAGVPIKPQLQSTEPSRIVMATPTGPSL